jgi:hypothetical protein
MTNCGRYGLRKGNRLRYGIIPARTVSRIENLVLLMKAVAALGKTLVIIPPDRNQFRPALLPNHPKSLP